LELNFIFEESLLNKKITENNLKKNGRKIAKTISDDNNTRLGTLNFLFCNSKTIKSYNRKYLSHNYETDIITFEYKDKLTGIADSDIIISITTVKKNAEFYKTDFSEEFYRVIIHGILHLCGFKDKFKKDKDGMRQKENFYLKKLKLNAG
jgi:rRNA maturation RNase YbeY